ncbi:hypothetical protein [Aquimarina sp. 2201CG14-23]|uniref:hypothetical protein n=1 Tax=Aquimarina mycalae TaxID=3040073 RepID=UPI002478120A|nr:hypothetical protein [Aquimarina sp. 2201CG14-23]MDH7446924.1 hypothetical protein [Aquimarina sp. 2201CG14-23]
MRKIIGLVLVALLWPSLFYSQDYPDAPIPDFYPASPEAAALGSYGSIERALQSGNMSFSAAIHSFKMGNYSWPITMNYSYGGLLLEGKQSILGLGWSLSGVGAVRREVRGLPDEHPEGYYGPRNRGVRIKDYMENGNNFSLAELKKYLTGEWDKEVDIYHVQAGPISFSFKQGENGNPVYLSQHNHKVHYTNQQITVTDDNGIVYIFADTENNLPSDATPNTAFEYTITWNLSEIRYPNGKTITYTYEDDQYLSYDFYASGGNQYFPTGLEDDSADGNTGPTYGIGTYQDGVNQSIINRKILKYITSSDNTTITFSIGEIDGKRKIYTGISVAKAGDFNAYELSYLGARDVLTEITKNGQLVYGFEYYDQYNIPDFIDSMDDRARAQDDWRFYNASINSAAINVPSSGNTVDKSPNLSATRIGAMKKINYPTGGYSLIDYEQNQIKKEYNSGSSGAQGNIATSVSFNKQILLKLQSDNSASAPEIKTSQFTKTFDQLTVATISSSFRGTRQRSHLTMSISRADNCPPKIDPITGEEEADIDPISDDYYINAPYFRNILNEAPEMCPTLGIEFGPDDGDPGYYSESHNSGGRIIIRPGTYTFKIINDYNRSSDAYGEIKVQFHEPVFNSDTSNHINVDIGGIRVEKIQHYTTNDSIAKTQYFDYNTDDKLSSGLLLNKFQKEVSFNIVNYSASTPENPSGRTEYDVIAYRLNRFNSLTVNQSAPVYYTHIKEFDSFDLIPIEDTTNDDWDGPPLIPFTNEDGTLVYSDIGDSSTLQNYIKTFPNGYKLTEFEAPAQNYDFEHPNYPQAQDLDKGRVKMVSVFKTKDSITSLIQKNVNEYQLFRGLLDQNYQDFNNNHPWSLKIAQKLNIIADCRIEGACDEFPIPSQEHYQIDRYIVKPYRELNTKYKPLSSVNTSYYDKDGIQQTLISTTTNTYNSHFSLKESTTQGTNGNEIKTVYKYPYNNISDFENLSNEASNGILALQSTNQIASPIETETYKKEGTTETLLFKKRTDYTSWGNNILGNTLWLPKKVRIAKGTNNLEERLAFHQYDAQGNPIDIAQIDGTHIYYIWGYEGQFPIAKITNFNTTQAASIQGLITTAITASNDDVSFPNGASSTSEQALRDALEAIRSHAALQASQMSYYTYDPLIGITSMTDARGYTMYYEYDNLNRLEFVRDEEGNLVSENKYNYKN